MEDLRVQTDGREKGRLSRNSDSLPAAPPCPLVKVALCFDGQERPGWKGPALKAEMPYYVPAF